MRRAWVAAVVGLAMVSASVGRAAEDPLTYFRIYFCAQRYAKALAELEAIEARATKVAPGQLHILRSYIEYAKGDSASAVFFLVRALQVDEAVEPYFFKDGECMLPDPDWGSSLLEDARTYSRCATDVEALKKQIESRAKRELPA